MTTRREYLESLLRCDSPSRDITQALKTFGWDSDEEVVTLKVIHVRDILARFLEGRLVASDVEEWANAIEGREDIGLEVGHEQLLSDIVFFLANPTLAEQLTRENATRLLADVSRQ